MKHFSTSCLAECNQRNADCKEDEHGCKVCDRCAVGALELAVVDAPHGANEGRAGANGERNGKAKAMTTDKVAQRAKRPHNATNGTR